MKGNGESIQSHASIHSAEESIFQAVREALGTQHMSLKLYYWPNSQFCSIYISLPGDILSEAEDDGSATCKAGWKYQGNKTLACDLFILTFSQGLLVGPRFLPRCYLQLEILYIQVVCGCLGVEVPDISEHQLGLRTTAFFQINICFNINTLTRLLG